MKKLLARCSVDGNTDFSFIPYGLSQTTTNETYRRQFVLHNNFLANMVVVPIKGISKEGIQEKAEEKLYKTSELRSIKETHFTKINGKWLLLTSKRDKGQVKREAEKLLKY